MTQLRSSFRLVLQSVIGGLAIAFIAIALYPQLITPQRRADSPTTGFAAAVARSGPAVVSVFTALGARPLAGSSAVPLRSGLGSGVIISESGYVVTNWHVVDGARQLVVQLADGRIAEPQLIGADPETELALLKLDLADLPFAELGYSDRLRPGDIVLAIGNSLGLSQTVTMGIVSATGRGQLNVAQFENFIQTDAAINIGSSGGALIDAQGRLVGINTAVVGRSGWQRTAPEGLGFAIPINLVRGVVAQLIEHGRVIRGYLGVELSDISAAEAESLGLSGSAVLVQEIREGPAGAAGLAPGDMLTHIDGRRITSAARLISEVASMAPGTRLRIRVVRVGGHAFETDAVLAERPGPTR
ncbi:MAG TPA: trypsin-like peptidase domain-containing protein [Gammaproteobacteria bacterium]|nr:trypsin-like peptidase domain-containing protein [Gammaproteobacteria bacterium]